MARFPTFNATQGHAAKRVSDARVRLLERAPFFGVLSLRLALVEQTADECPTMAVDGISLFYSVAFVNSVPDSELTGVVCHEVLHCAYRHFARRGNRDPELWNYACDYALNPAVIAAGFKLPAGCLIDQRFANMSAETIYDILLREQKAGQPKPGNGKPQAGDVRDTPKRDDKGNAIDPVELEGKWQDATTQAVNVAQRRAKAGQAMAGLDTFKASVGAAQVDWRYELSRYTDFSSYRDNDWTRPNKRFAWQGMSLPSMVPQRPSLIVLAVDTSGSMDANSLSNILAEMQSVLDSGACDRVAVIYANTRVQSVSEYEPGDTIDTTPKRGSGGTDFADTFDRIASDYPDASAVIYLTDGGTSDWGAEPDCPVVWAMTLPAQWLVNVKPPFGDMLPLL